ncbi:MAG: hydantoinase/oxoprolinase family protein [bacterium]
MTFDQEKIWQIWIDTGGTFTDCLAKDPTGSIHRAKVLSSSALRGKVKKKLSPKRLLVQEKWSAPADFIRGFRFRLLESSHPEVSVRKYDPSAGTIELSRSLPVALPQGAAFEVLSPEEAPILAARLVTGATPGAELPAIAMRLATTRGTNALLERRGAPTVLFITRGFGDLLRIGTQQRPDLFALNVHKPEPLYQSVVEVEERIAADGTVLQPLNLQALRRQVETLEEISRCTAAVALLHSYRNSSHEVQLAQFLTQKGFQHVSCSSELAPFIKIVPRAETTVVDAYLAPVIEDYLQEVRLGFANGRLHAMTSAGGLVEATTFRAKDSLLSGPAGGVVGAATAGRRSGFEQLIAFDMGGTSTDVARFDGDYEYVFEHQVGDAHLVAPALAIESVAAGGGSICSFDGHRLRVGPESAGARPGPACYGAGGPLTLTDVNLLLGRLDPERFEIPIAAAPARQALATLADGIAKQTGQQVHGDALLQGFLDIANERMADAIRRVSLRKGYDPQEYVLVAFGGAAGQHAGGVAERLEINTVLVPPDASLLSAMGLGQAVLERFAERQVLQPLDPIAAQVPLWLAKLEAQAVAAVQAEGVAADAIEVRRRILNLRFVGQDSVLSVEFPHSGTLQQAFQQHYLAVFGHRPEGRAVELESIRVVASSRPAADAPRQESPRPLAVAARGSTQASFAGKRTRVPVYHRAQLAPGAWLNGPALIFERHSTTVVEPGWQASVDGAASLVLTFRDRQK